MATCIKTQTIYAFATSSDSTKTGYPVYVLDAATPLSSCNTLAISSAEYQDLQHGYITSRDDAEQIAGALILLFAIVFGYKVVRQAFDAGDSPLSDEKH